MLATGDCISGFIAVVRWPVQIGGAEDAEFASDPHGETGVSQAGQLTGSLAGPKQRRRNPIKIRIVELACKTQAHRFLPSASSNGSSPPLSINCEASTLGWWRVAKCLRPLSKRRRITSGGIGIECPPWATISGAFKNERFLLCRVMWKQPRARPQL